ncbi:MAG: ABC transporter permease [Chitinophagaceae bacterium]
MKNTAMSETGYWREIITPRHSLFSLRIREIWNYRDLLLILIRRDIIAVYKQTILGPLWFFIQPLLTTITYVLIFSRIGKLSTASLPPVIFYLSGLILWQYFSECILRTATFFKDNSQILTKVYFPRLIIPLSLILTNLVKFGIQLLLFFVIYGYYVSTDSFIKPNAAAFLFPVLILLTGLLGLGMGVIISSLTTRYKDLIHLLAFGVQLLMFASPVIFPLSSFANTKLKYLIMANPMSGIIEAFRYGFLGKGYFSWELLAYDTTCILFFLGAGIFLFNSVEKSFVDTI